MTTESSLPAKKVAFRIAENFERTVGPNMTEFSKLIKKQVEEQLSLPKDVIQDIYVTRGSIQVTMALQGTRQVTVDDLVMELSQALGEGQLNLKGPNNQPLDVPRQPLQVLREPTEQKSGLSAVFLASATVSICALCIVYVVLVTVITKYYHRKQAIRIAQRKAAQSTPKYLTLPLPHTLDGANITNIKNGFYNGDDLDSGVYNSDGARKNIPKESHLMIKPQKPGLLPGIPTNS